ncbi:P2X purinoceptor 4 isoform X1 [Ursus maritimus]|uniref:P2X purinoceptor n=1 Tax=Ursus maritimus TaxID=29073 RepID=A0A8M1EY98_URSMA|nr:P2X purinoceptor 4 isoform X1 [Ursus maritimus]
MAGCCAALAAFLFEYDTPRIVLIRSRKVGLMNRAVQLLILAYVIGWVFVWEKGYQETDSVVSSVTTKAKGVTVTNTSTLGFRVWDVADYVIPAQEENSLFIMTNMIITMNQTQGFCPELPDKTTVCKSDANCVAGSSGTHSNGIATGRCVLFNGTVKTCEVAAWCPVEDDTHVPKPAFLKAAENFTLLVKNNIWYPKFNFSKRNILPNITTTYLKSCIYDAVTDPFCPIFRLGKIVERAGHSFQDMAIEGGIMGIQINWDCNLDRTSSLCLPRYSFRRLDTRDVDHNVSPGYNFRFWWLPVMLGVPWLIDPSLPSLPPLSHGLLPFGHISVCPLLRGHQSYGIRAHTNPVRAHLNSFCLQKPCFPTSISHSQVPGGYKSWVTCSTQESQSSGKDQGTRVRFATSLRQLNLS